MLNVNGTGLILVYVDATRGWIKVFIASSNIPTVTTDFNTHLSATDTTVQAALETLDDHTHSDAGVDYVPLETTVDYTIPTGYSFVGCDEFTVSGASC